MSTEVKIMIKDKVLVTGRMDKPLTADLQDKIREIRNKHQRLVVVAGTGLSGVSKLASALRDMEVIGVISKPFCFGPVELNDLSLETMQKLKELQFTLKEQKYEINHVIDRYPSDAKGFGLRKLKAKGYR